MSARSRWFNVFRSNNPQACLHLYCFPHGGGGSATYREWPSLLPRDIEVRAIQMPGREGRFDEPPCTRMEDLVHQLAQALLPELGVPFAFFGHSLGSLVALELARLLRRDEGMEPVHLFASGRPAPHLPTREPPLSSLSDEELVATLRAQVGESPGPASFEPEVLKLFMPVLRADVALFESYRHVPGVLLDCPLSGYGGADDPVATPEQIQAWSAQTTGAFTHRTFPGGHFFINSARAAVVEDVAACLRSIIEKRLYEITF